MLGLLGKNQLEVKDQNNNLRQVHITNVKKTMPEVIIKTIPDCKQFGRAAKLRLNPNKIEDLGWEIPEKFPTQSVYPDPEVSEVMELVPKITTQGHYDNTR